MSGHLQLDGEVIRYRSRRYGDWDLPLKDVRVIGECTNQLGPFADDYFLCFATGLGMWLEASFYSEGSGEFLRQLGAKLGTSLEFGLCNSTDFASRVLWPMSLAEEPMFKYSESPQESLVCRLLRIGKNSPTYSDRVSAYLHGELYGDRNRTGS